MKVAAVLRTEKPEYVAKVIGAIADMIVGGTDQENARLSNYGIKVSKARKGGGLVVKVPKSTEDFQKLVKRMAAEVPK
jgi:hypothetical protein